MGLCRNMTRIVNFNPKVNRRMPLQVVRVHLPLKYEVLNGFADVVVFRGVLGSR